MNELSNHYKILYYPQKSLVSFKKEERKKNYWQFKMDQGQTGRRKICAGLLQTINKYSDIKGKN